MSLAVIGLSFSFDRRAGVARVIAYRTFDKRAGIGVEAKIVLKARIRLVGADSFW
jgi:hypothetical protein